MTRPNGARQVQTARRQRSKQAKRRASSLAEPKLERLPAVLRRVPISRSALYERVRAGTFPKPIPLGPQTVAWIATEIDQWIAGQIAAARNGDSGEITPRMIAST